MKLRNKKVFIGTSGGVNSAAVIIDTINRIKCGDVPKELHLMYVHINQHSDDTLPFVQALIAYSKHHFPKAVYWQNHVDVLKYFEEAKMIPHPTASPCTRKLKTEPMAYYKQENQIDIDLVGYVNNESSRLKGMISAITGEKEERIKIEQYLKNGLQNGMFETIHFPIFNLTTEECFSKVKEAIGWYPSIYDLMWTDKRLLPFLKSMKGVMPEDARQIALKYAQRGYGWLKSERIFNHNNCLPCKNMQTWQYWLIKLFYPEHFKAAMQLCEKLNLYYGRNKKEFNEAMMLYTSFGRHDYEVNFQEQSCGACALG